VSPRFGIGIDLGTTNCALARVDLADHTAPSQIVELEQLVTAHEVGRRSLLPSFLYLPPESEGALALPWDMERRFAVGAHAQRRAPEAPGRVIASAKSWLCHPTVDRRGALLPLGAPEDVERISPVEASWRYLEHLVEAYDAAHAAEGGPLVAQRVVLTVPASFDAAARELTVEAALAAGFEDLILLEEPQAALYAWLEHLGDGWRRELQPGDVVLVIDVGGGTSDFSAIEVRDQDGELCLVRVAVGDHILLGGDNIDLAIAHHLRQRLAAEGTTLDDWQMAALTHAARVAKETLLGDNERDRATVVVPRRGAKLVGGAIKSELSRAEVDRLVLDGFFPLVEAAARPAERRRVGLTQLGLPYAGDPAVTRHLAAFLGRQAGATGEQAGGLLRPSAVLFNGGVMKSGRLRERLRGALDGWVSATVRELASGDLDVAVARGAACYARATLGRGVRIRGGTARAYYVGIEGAVPAVPGIEPPLTLMCVAPFGMEEGTRATLPPHQLALVVGEPVHFRFFGSSVRRDDRAGCHIERWGDDVDELPAIAVTLPAGERAEGEVVPVRLEAAVTAIGTLDIEARPLEPRRSDESWTVELSIRGDAQG
jgi:hypothetical protein